MVMYLIPKQCKTQVPKQHETSSASDLLGYFPPSRDVTARVGKEKRASRSPASPCASIKNELLAETPSARPSHSDALLLQKTAAQKIISPSSSKPVIFPVLPRFSFHRALS